MTKSKIYSIVVAALLNTVSLTAQIYPLSGLNYPTSILFP